MAVGVKGDSTFEAGVPKALFATPLLDPSPHFDSNYGVTADGQRFLISSSVKSAASEMITVVVNWTAELRKQ